MRGRERSYVPNRAGKKTNTEIHGVASLSTGVSDARSFIRRRGIPPKCLRRQPSRYMVLRDTFRDAAISWNPSYIEYLACLLTWPLTPCRELRDCYGCRSTWTFSWPNKGLSLVEARQDVGDDFNLTLAQLAMLRVSFFAPWRPRRGRCHRQGCLCSMQRRPEQEPIEPTRLLCSGNPVEFGHGNLRPPSPDPGRPHPLRPAETGTSFRRGPSLGTRERPAPGPSVRPR